MLNDTDHADGVIDSALRFTFLRALSHMEPNDNFKNPDYLAELFLAEEWKKLLNARALSIYFSEKKYPGAYGYALARTHHIDKLLSFELKKGVEQLVILGAGNDSRSIRFSNELKNSTIFELDFPGTQKEKIKALARAGIKKPAKLNFIPIDFEREKISDKLLKAGYSTDKSTLVVWEGVTYYLELDAILKVFRFFEKTANVGVIFDYALEDFVNGEIKYYGAKETLKWSRDAGEPLKTGFSKISIRNYLESCRFEVISDVGARYLENSYLAEGEGSSIYKVLGSHRLCYAKLVKLGLS